MKKLFCILAFTLFFSAFFSAATETNGYFLITPLLWKGNITITMSGFIGIDGLNEILDNGIVGLFNYNQDIYVGFGFIPEKRGGNFVYREVDISGYYTIAQLIYTIKTGKFTYLDKLGSDSLAVLSYNQFDDMYYANDLSQCISKIKGQGTIFDPVVPYFTSGIGLTLYNSDEANPTYVTDSLVTVSGSGNLLKYTGFPYPGTKVKVTLKRRTGKINIKYRTETGNSGNPNGSLQPALMEWIEEITE